jgi:hypothetical protein
MSVTFDQWLDIVCRTSEPETGFSIQADVHAAAALMDEWAASNLSNAQMIEALNFDGADSELTTVKTHLNGLTKAETLALQSAMILAADQVALTGITYNKSLLRTRFGLI